MSKTVLESPDGTVLYCLPCGLSQSVDWLLFWGWGLLFNVIVDYVRI